ERALPPPSLGWPPGRAPEAPKALGHRPSLGVEGVPVGRLGNGRRPSPTKLELEAPQAVDGRHPRKHAKSSLLGPPGAKKGSAPRNRRFQLQPVCTRGLAPLRSDTVIATHRR